MIQNLKKSNKITRKIKEDWFFTGYFGVMVLGALLGLWDVRAAAAAGVHTGGTVGWIGLALVVCFVMCVVAAYAARSGWPDKRGRRVLRVLYWLTAAGDTFVAIGCLPALLP